jgi:pyruvate dehydrogenase E2 component (dihydrolipoamide acetyltransferase)
MPTEVIMPQMGESIFEGTITRWLKKPGDTVEKDEPLLEISTDKVDAEIPSPAAGVLLEIKAQEGATVQINAVLAVIGEGSLKKPAPAKSAEATKDAKTEAQGAAAPATSASGQVAGSAARGAGAIEVVMPQMGESIFEGTITKWFKKSGDRVEKDEPLFEISTDKVDAEIPSPAAGILTEIKAQEGATVHINAVVAVVTLIGGSGAAAPASVTAAAEPVMAGVAAPARTQVAPAAETKNVRTSPLVRRMAKEHKIDVARVRGTGLGARVTKEDMLRHLSEKPATAAQGQTAAAAAEGVQPLSRMRAIIGQRMVESLAISPHAHTVYRVDMTRIARLRERERAGFEQRHGVRLTYMPFIAAAAVRALQKFPIVNASLIDGAIHYHESIHLGIAVALEWGLLVPVIREAQRRSLADLARAINDLATRARGKKLNPDEASGSTFTLTNSGLFGGEFGTPIINQPESAILAIGGLRKEPVVLTDAEGNDTIAIRSMQYYCLGFDHRTIDGADAGKFMLEFKDALENWDRAIG